MEFSVIIIIIITLPLRVPRGDTSFEISNFQRVKARERIPSAMQFLLLQYGVMLNKIYVKERRQVLSVRVSFTSLNAKVSCS
jgi:hypothetical protein